LNTFLLIRAEHADSFIPYDFGPTQRFKIKTKSDKKRELNAVDIKNPMRGLGNES
jgi:hypothetical protein